MSVRRRAIKARLERDRKSKESYDRQTASLWALRERIKLAIKQGRKTI